MIEHSESIQEISKALLKVQGELNGVVKDGRNPHYRSSYATLEAVIETARPALQKAGVVFLQAPGEVRDGRLALSTMLMHPASGQWLRSTMEMPLSKQDPQGTGSGITYAERYSLMALLGLPPLDDDAEGAMACSSNIVTGNGRPPTNTTVLSEPSATEAAERLKEDLNKFETPDELARFIGTDHFKHRIGALPQNHKNMVRVAYKAKSEKLKIAAEV